MSDSTRSAWLKIDIDVPYAGQPVDVFALAGINLHLLRARFQGSSRVDATLGQPPRQATSGSITGDWEINIGGFPIANLVNCALIYQEGSNLRFDVSVDRIQLQSVLEFISDLLADFGGASGFTFVINEKGAAAVLSLPFPDVDLGTFGLSNLSLGFFFALDFFNDFTLSTGLNIATRTAPFTLTIFILGGAGYFESDISYQPNKHLFSTHVSAGIFAAAGLAISLGPISGSIYAYFGLTVDFFAGDQQPSSLDLRIVILFRGEVSLLGFLSVTLILSLEAGYQTGGRLSGRGTISYSIKIGWFININVCASVQYGFGQASGGGASNSHQLEASQHEAMFA